MPIPRGDRLVATTLWLALAFAFSLAAFARAQASPMLATGSSADSLLISGKQMLREGSLDAMYAAKATFERTSTDTALAAWSHYYIALAGYRIADHLLAAGEENKGAASEHLKTTVNHLQKATEINPQAAEAYALLASAYGRQIGLNPVKGMVLGRRAEQALKKRRSSHPTIRASCYARPSATLIPPECLVAAKKRACKDSSAPPNFSPKKSQPIPSIPYGDTAAPTLGSASLTKTEASYR